MLEKSIKKMKIQLMVLAFFTFFLSPIFAWGSILSSDETAVYASLSRMIWFSGSPGRIFIAMVVLFVPMIISFFSSHKLQGLSKTEKIVCRVSMIVSCIVLYVGAMEVIPSDGTGLSFLNILHGVLSFGGIFMIFLTYCIYVVIIRKKKGSGANLLFAFLVFILISGPFAVLNVFDDKSYVVASAVSELYILIMLSITGYLTFYLAFVNKQNNPDKVNNGFIEKRGKSK